jgi:hypothetical protein
MGIGEWKGPEPTERLELAARIQKEQAKPAASRTLEENVGLAVDLLHFGKPDDAEGALKGQRGGFLPNITLAHIAVAQRQWPRAYEFLDIANEYDQPTELPGMKAKQLAWHRKLNKGPLKRLIKLRLDESKEKPSPENELPDQIWPVKFVNDAGIYEPGLLAIAEKAKLPGGDFKEAIATVQQLVLWFPFDVRLYWLLGELYAAKGEIKAALDIMDECVNTGRYSNRKVLMQHREVIAKAVSELPPPPTEAPPEETPPPPPVPISLKQVWIYFGVVGVIALFALVRAIVKMRKGN